MNYQNNITKILSSFYVQPLKCYLNNCIESIRELHEDSASKIVITLDVPKDVANFVAALIPDVTQQLSMCGIIGVQIILTSNGDGVWGKNRSIAGVRNIIIIASGKGGVGKSTFAFNIAAALADKGLNVGLADIDIYGPSLPGLTGINNKPTINDGKMIPIKKYGIKMMSTGFLIEKDEALIWRGPMASKMLGQILDGTCWDYDGVIADYLIIDTPPGTSDVHLSLLERYIIDCSIIIATPQDLAIDDVRRCITMFKRFNTSIIGIINNYCGINMNGELINIFGDSKNIEKLSKESSLSIISSIPLSSIIHDAAVAKKPVIFYDEIRFYFDDIAEKIIQYFSNDV